MFMEFFNFSKCSMIFTEQEEASTENQENLDLIDESQLLDNNEGDDGEYLPEQEDGNKC